MDREKILEKRRLYYANNKEKFAVYAREQRIKHNKKIKLHKQAYYRTKRGLLFRIYGGMKKRILGYSKCPHLYIGKDICDRESFYNWAVVNEAFNKLFNTWEQEKYIRKLVPSINRINSKLGYTLDNMEFITNSENCRLGALSKHYG